MLIDDSGPYSAVSTYTICTYYVPDWVRRQAIWRASSLPTSGSSGEVSSGYISVIATTMGSKCADFEYKFSENVKSRLPSRRHFLPIRDSKSLRFFWDSPRFHPTFFPTFQAGLRRTHPPRTRTVAIKPRNAFTGLPAASGEVSATPAPPGHPASAGPRLTSWWR